MNDKPSADQADEWGAYFAHLGHASIDHYDRVRMLDAIREQRRRYAGNDAIEATVLLAETFREALRTDVEITDAREVSDVLLAMSGYMATLAASGGNGYALANVLGFVGESLAKESGS